MRCKLYKNIFTLIFLLGFSFEGQCQNHSIFSSLKNTIKRADKYYKNFSYTHAIQLYNKALEKDPSNENVKLKIANCYRLINNSSEAEKWYSEVIKNKKIIQPIDKLQYGQTLLANKKYDESKKWFYEYNKDVSNDSIGLRKINGIDNLKSFFEDSLCFSIRELNINTKYPEFSPVYYNQGIVFVSAREGNSFIDRKSSRDQNSFFDIYYSEFNEHGELKKPTRLDRNINNKLHEGPVAFCDNDNKIIITRNIYSNTSKKRVNRLMLYEANKSENGQWENIKPLPFNNIAFSLGHPTLSKDGKTLYFISDMPGGLGGTDIYVSKFIDSTWSSPINLGKEINTSGNELFPYLQNDSTLYFSSNGYGGLGGLDIYKSEIHDGKYSNLKNIGYPINSSSDDFGIVFSKNEKSGFLSSNRNKGTNDDDLFSFDVIKILVEGIAVGKLKNKPLDQVTLKLSLKGNEELVSINQKDGKFYLDLDPGKDYQLIASRNGYKTIRKNISTKESVSKDPIYLKLQFEKTNKIYVNGVVKTDSSKTVPNMNVIYQEIGSDLKDTIHTDEHGEFHYEVDADMEHLFFTEDNEKFGTISLNTKNKKGSFLIYVNIEMQKYVVKTIKGVVRGNSPTNSGILILIKNENTGKSDSLCTDASGCFSFEAKSYANYSITVQSGETNETIPFNSETFEKEIIIIELKKN